MSAFKTWLTGLTSKTTPVDADETYLRDSEDSGASKKLTWANLKATMKSYTDTLYLALTGGTVAGGTRTTSGSTLTITETLNNAAVTFPGALVVDVTDTASNAASLLADFKVGGTSVSQVSKAGMVSVRTGSYNNPGIRFGTTGNDGLYWSNGLYILASGNVPIMLGASGVLVPSNTASVGFGLCAAGSSTADTLLTRDAADTFAQKRDTNAQTFRTYGTYTDASNYRRIALAMTTAGVATLAPEGAGTGASGNVLHISGLPTSNPGAGILWNDAGTVKVGT